MKREGRQHGTMVRYSSSTTNTRLPSSPSGPVKPTNRSKHTGKCSRARCGNCHLHPVSKSKDKAKGAYKLRSCDVSLNHRLVSWRVVDHGVVGGGGYAGVSASGIVGYLSGYHRDSRDDEEEEEEEEEEVMYDCGEFGEYPFDGGVEGEEEIEEQGEEIEVNEIGTGIGGGDDEEEDDDMGFYQVGFVWEYVDEEDWCVVGEM